MSQHLGRRVHVVLPVLASAVVVFLSRQGPRREARKRSLVALALLVASCSGLPPTVDRITISNPTAYDIDVEVTDRDRDGWLPMAIVQARSEHVAQDVIDQGEVWIFRFLHWGDPVGEFSPTRAELERNGWRVEVPAEVEERLQQLGRPMSGELVDLEPGGGG
jgi:hypothetical protein